MAKLAIFATAEIAPGRTDEVLPILMAHRERCLKSESGTMEFEVLRALGAGGREDPPPAHIARLVSGEDAWQVGE